MKNDKWATIAVDMDCSRLAIQRERKDFADAIDELDLLVESGYADQARKRIGWFAKYLRQGRAIPRKHFLRFCDQLDLIAAGENAEKVLGLKKGKGKAPDLAKLKRLKKIASFIAAYMHVAGLTLENAIAALTDETEMIEMRNQIKKRMNETGARFDGGYVEYKDDDYKSDEVSSEEYALLRERTDRYTVHQLVEKISNAWVNGGAFTTIYVKPSLIEVADSVCGDASASWGDMSNINEREARLAWEIYAKYFRERQETGKIAPLNLKAKKRNTSRSRKAAG